MKKVPQSPLLLMTVIYTKVMPEVHSQLQYWQRRAQEIPDPELKKQAVASIESKTFHCEGGGIFGILAGAARKQSIEFIVAYQTISDYLDNLCDRSTSQEANDFRALHEAMLHALTPDATPINYYRFRTEQQDGGYLEELVLTCQNALKNVPHYSSISEKLHELAGYYCDLQVYKHIKATERVPKLREWFGNYKQQFPGMSWYEFSACTGSTLGIFCLVSYAYQNEFDAVQAEAILKGYFPYIQGLHILLDYFIDQEEDRHGGDLNFCFYYPREEDMLNRFKHFVDEANRHTEKLPDKNFHRLINHGLLGIYLSDRKVTTQKEVKRLAKQLLQAVGGPSRFFYVNGLLYRKLAGSR